MSDFPLFGESEALQHGFVPATVLGTAITSPASINTKGAWIELVSSVNNTFDSSLEVCFVFFGSANALFLVDVGVGSPGSEQVIVPNLWCNTTTTAVPSSDFVRVPITIPRGQRISMRCQSSVSSAEIPAYIKLIPSNFMQPSSVGYVISIGSNTSTTSGVTVATTTAGTFGSWVEVVSSLSDSIKGFFVSAQKDAPASWSNLRVAYQLSIGGAGSETVIFDSQVMTQTSSEGQSSHFSSVNMIPINEGERISIRAVSSVTNADANFDYVIYGVK